MTKRRCIQTKLPTMLLFLLIFALATAAQQPPAPRVFDLSAQDGTKLKATFFAAAKPGPGILLLHQCNRQRKVWDDLAQRLAASGVNVLTMDFRGFGESGGTPLEKLTNEEIAQLFAEKFPADVDTAYSYLTSQPGVTPGAIAAGGASCGVNQSVQLARRHPEVKALVLLSEGTDADGRAFLRKKGDMPMFLAAAADDPDPGVVQIMEWLAALSANPANRMESYQKGGHGVEMFPAHLELESEIVEWVGTVFKLPGGKLKPSGAPTPTPQTRFLDAIDQPGGAAKAAKLLAEARQHDAHAVLFTEELMNRVGYEHLQVGDKTGAIELFKLNVAAFPNSANVYDSLSDGYLADGQKDLARQNAQKAVALLATDTSDAEDRKKNIRDSAEQKLKQLGPSPK
jgi:dienelactone hydrolase